MDMETAARDNLLTLANAYSKATGLKLSTISNRVAGDSRFFENLAKPDPGSFSFRIYVRAVAKFKAAWPEGDAMPSIWEPDLPTGPAKRRLRR